MKLNANLVFRPFVMVMTVMDSISMIYKDDESVTLIKLRSICISHVYYLMVSKYRWNLYSDGQQVHQCQQNQLYPKIMEHKKTNTNDVRNTWPGLGQARKCCVVKPVHIFSNFFSVPCLKMSPSCFISIHLFIYLFFLEGRGCFCFVNKYIHFPT